MPYRVIIQRPKAQIAVRAGNRARNPASYTPRRRLAEDDGLRAKEAPAAGTDSRARAGLNRENNSTSHHGGQEARRTPRSCCECRRGMRDPAPNAKPRHSCGLRRRRLRAAFWGAATLSRRAPRVLKRSTHTGKDAASTAAALAKAFGSSDADGCWLLSLVASDSTAPWSMTYYGKVLDGFARRPVTFFVRF